MTSAVDFPLPNSIQLARQGNLGPVHEYCGVCHGVLKVDDCDSPLLNKATHSDPILRTSSSSESFPLPSSASAVGTVHPCGHLFHVSCFHNHNNKQRKSGHDGSPRSSRHDAMVEILDDDGGSCVEIKSSDEFADSLTHEDFNECPTCRKRAFLFVEMSSTAMPYPHRPLNDAVGKLTIDSTETEDDADSTADTDIMNYYSFNNTVSGDGDSLFVDTTNIMAQNLMMLGIAHRNMKQSHSDTSTEYHDTQSISSKVVASAVSVVGHRDEEGCDVKSQSSEHRKDNTSSFDSEENPTANNALPDAQTPKKLLFFDSRAMPTTPGIMITPGTIQRRKTSKKVRFFDGHTHSLLEVHSASEEECPKDKPALLDQVGSEEEDREENGVVEISDSDVREEPYEGAVSLKDEDDEHSEGDNDSTNIPLASTTTEDSQEEEMNLANGLVLPSSDSKMLLWNVSTYEEEGDCNLGDRGFVDTLQREIDELRHQLIQSEQEKEDAQRKISRSRTREMGAVAGRAMEGMRLKEEVEKSRKEIETLRAQQTENQEEIMATEEELATTQIQLETVIDSHQQAQAKLQDEMNKANEELEEVKYELETCQQELEEATKAANLEKEELVASQGKRQEEMKQEYDTKVETLQGELGQARKELEENKTKMEACQQEMESTKAEKESLSADHDQRQKEHDTELEKIKQELNSVHEDWETTQYELSASKESLCEHEKAATAEKEFLVSQHKERENQLIEEHEVAVKELQENNDQTKLDLESTRRDLLVAQQELQKQITATTATNAALVAKHKEDICGLREEYGAKLEATYATLGTQMESFREFESNIKQSQQEFNVTTAELEAELERERKSNADLAAKLVESQKQIVMMVESQKLSEHSTSELHSEIDRMKKWASELLAQREEAQSSQVVSYESVQSELDKARKESETPRAQLQSELARQKQSNAVLELQLEKSQEQMEILITQLKLQPGSEVQLQLLQTQKSNTALEVQRKNSQGETEKSMAELKSELEKQTQLATKVQTQLQQALQRLEIVDAELDEAKVINDEESEEMTYLKSELESTRLDIEKLVSNMHASAIEMTALRKELNAAKDALGVATNDMDLQRMSTSTSSLSPHHIADDSSYVHSLQEELRQVRQELVAKNQFIQGQLTMAKGKLIEYVRTKEGELEHTKIELAQTKQTLKNKNASFGRQLQETEHELLELSSMKETLRATMNDLTEKNTLITRQLEEAQAELAFLEETNQQLREAASNNNNNNSNMKKGEHHHALSVVTDLKLGNAFAVAAVFMGHWLSECAKAKFNVNSNTKNNTKSNQSDPIPEINADLQT